MDKLPAVFRVASDEEAHMSTPSDTLCWLILFTVDGYRLDRPPGGGRTVTSYSKPYQTIGIAAHSDRSLRAITSHGGFT